MTTRREFLAVTALAPLGLLLGQRTSWALPAGARDPAPVTPPGSGPAGALSASTLRNDGALASAAVDTARAQGASYADARLVRLDREHVEVEDDRIDRISRAGSYGIGVRVLVDGAWGFAATPRVDKASVNAAVKRAIRTAKDSAKLAKELGAAPVELAPVEAVVGEWVSPHDIDPFSIAPADKAALLLEAAAAAMKVRGVEHVRASTTCTREEKVLVTSDGVKVHQLFFRVEPELSATAIDRRRGRFASRAHEAPPLLAGWESVTALGLKEAAPEIARDALQKLHAPSVKPGKRAIILAPSNLWLTIHESIGHPTELDRAMGLEANFAGTSFIKPDDAGRLRIGSNEVTLVADRTQPGGLASVAWDDEGVPAQRWDIVKDGMFVGWQTTRDQAAWIGEARSRGCSYGHGYEGVAFQRMPNVSLQPGKQGWTTEDLVNATEDGVLVSGRGSWSIDHQRHNFQFSGQMFHEIKKGRIRRVLRDVAYQASTLAFWQSCDMVGGAGTYRLGGSMGDGKGEPSQSNAVSHGCPPARFLATIVNTGGER